MTKSHCNIFFISRKSESMNTISVILCLFWFSFFFMYFLTMIAPEYVEDEDGFIIPKNKYLT